MRTQNAILATSSQLGFAAVVTVSSSQILFSSRHREREREGENLPLEDTNLFCCHAVKSVVFFYDITVSLKMDYCCVKSFKCFLLHCCLLEDGLLLCEEF